MKRSAKHHFRKGAPGFALVATLLMMMLLVILSVGMFTLSSISLRKEGREIPMLQARANARIALMIAIGKLQETLGPDQRVSADARVANNGRGNPANPHWVSVWKTVREDGKPWIIRDGEKGGHTDLRATSGRKAEDDRITTLVSGNETEIRYLDKDQLDDQRGVTLVGEGSLGDAAQESEQVKAPLVPIVKAKKQEGSYAWWIGDLGTRANIRTGDGTEKRNNGDNYAVSLAQDVSFKAFGGNEIPSDRRNGIIDEPQLALIDQKYDRRHFHDYTVWSNGLPINVRDGGWKKDLTAYMESNGTIPDYKKSGVNFPGLKDSDNLVGPTNTLTDKSDAFPGQAKRFQTISPKFGLLRKWSDRADSAPEGAYSITSELGESVIASTGGRNERSVDFRNRTKSHLMPVLVEGSLYYNLSYYDAPASTPPSPAPFGLRLHLYPRVVLWNPYNFSMQVPASGIFMHINGAKQVEVTMDGGIKRSYRMFWGLNANDSESGGATRGSMFFKMDAATLEPGQSVVWSPSKNAIYQDSDFNANTLTPTLAPSPSRSFYMDKRVEASVPLFEPLSSTTSGSTGQILVPNRAQARPLEWREIVPPRPAGNVQSNKYTQADDYLMSWKPISGNFTLASFQQQPMGRFVSCAYQYGDEDEMPVEWTSLDPVPFARTLPNAPTMSQIPDRRTREGFRLRWSQETESNLIGSGSLINTGHLEDSAIGNWNMRASWSFRNPFDNVSDLAPNFFGIYTRDLFDGEVDWSSVNPRSSGSKFLGDPFDQPIRGIPQRILFDVPRRGTEIASLGAFQHVNFSEFIWHPTYALGNSLADPRVPIDHTEPDRSNSINKDKGGWNQNSIGHATDGRSDNNGNENRTDEDNWAWSARSYLQQAALDQSVIYDLSYELNHTLWDGYFLSSGTAQEKGALLSDQDRNALPNGRIRLNSMAGKITEEDLTNYHLAASRLMIDGAFNVNSTSVSAWEALLLSGVDKKYGDKVAFPRFLNAPGAEWNGNDARNSAAWSGQRVFTRDQIRILAEQIVKQVEERGPFLSLGDFINRRLTEGEQGKKGALQAAIDLSELNESFHREWPLDNRTELPDFKSIDNIDDSTRMEQTLKPDTTAWGALGFLTQADLLQFIGPALSARSDTFRVRAYGESVDASGKILARAYCEAVVQRSPKYVDGSDDLLEGPQDLNATNERFGRRFEIQFFRWLAPEEV